MVETLSVVVQLLSKHHIQCSQGQDYIKSGVNVFPVLESSPFPRSTMKLEIVKRDLLPCD